MRWDELFDDLEARAAALEAGDLAAEVAERTRAERAAATLLGRATLAHGAEVRVGLATGEVLAGPVLGAGPGWLTLGGPGGAVVVLAAVHWVQGLPPGTGRAGAVRRRTPLPTVLRLLARDRSPVRLLLRGGGSLAGTLDVVAADHLELAEHDGGDRRAGAVRRRLGVPLEALAAVLPAPGRADLG